MQEEPQELLQAYRLYTSGDYAQAYELLTRTAHLYPDWEGRFYEIRMDMAAMLKGYDLAEDILAAALDAGYFYNEWVLRKDSDVQPLQGRPRFETLVKRSFDALSQAQRDAKPELKVLEPKAIGKDLLPLLIGLHGNNSNAEGFSEIWQPLVKKNWLVALPQSSQLCAKGLFVWNDLDCAEREIADHYAYIHNNFRFDPNKMVISGFSKGGQAAFLCALKELVPVRGILGLAPFMGDLSTLLPLLGKTGQERLRCYFVLGENDPNCTPGSIQLAEKMKEYGIRSEVEIIKGMEHAVPDHFDEILDRAIRFILNE